MSMLNRCKCTSFSDKWLCALCVFFIIWLHKCFHSATLHCVKIYRSYYALRLLDSMLCVCPCFWFFFLLPSAASYYYYYWPTEQTYVLWLMACKIIKRVREKNGRKNEHAFVFVLLICCACEWSDDIFIIIFLVYPNILCVWMHHTHTHS